MKKMFRIDDFMVAFIAALGYGFGETIARLSGWSEIMCIVACFAVGIFSEEIISAIVFSKAVQKSPRKRVLTFVAILLLFLIGQYISVRWMGVSMLEYLQEEFLFAVGLPVIGFVVNMFIRGYRTRKIRRLYGDGSKGYVFDLKKEDIEEANRQNKPINGKYDESLAVKTRTGIYVGEKNEDIICYYGIPYAKPPVGNLRWKAPEQLPSSDAVFEARYFGASSIQVEHRGAILKDHRQSEDCLSLNICVGSEKTPGRKPVIVLFHYGDFTFGGSADPLLCGADYISRDQDAVFVSFNYRLGIFGFIDFSEVPGGDAYPDAINLGLLDQIAALEWIRENIAAFGGDPDQITVMGFESGATSILMLAASERAKGLFRKAFIFNGSSATVYDSPEGARNLAKELLKETDVSTMDELVRLDGETLKEAAQRLWKSSCAPTFDGELIPASLDEAFRNGAASGIEFLIGIPKDETRVFRAFVSDQDYGEFISAGIADILSVIDESAADEVKAYIETQAKASNELEAGSKIIDQWLAVCIYRSALKLSECGNKVHLMYWDERPLIENLGSGTVDAAATLLGNEKALELYGSVINKDLSEILQAMLKKFINGKKLQLYPNEIDGVEAIDWKPFPKAFIVSDGKITCGEIEDRLTDIKGFRDLALK